MYFFAWFFWIGRKKSYLSGSMPNNSTPPFIVRLTVIRLKSRPFFRWDRNRKRILYWNGANKRLTWQTAADFVSFNKRIISIPIDFTTPHYLFLTNLQPMWTRRIKNRITVATIIICWLTPAIIWTVSRKWGVNLLPWKACCLNVCERF